MGEAERELVPRTDIHRGSIRHVLRLDGDALAHVEAVAVGLVRPPGIAMETRVEVNMPFDEAGHDQRLAKVDGRCGCCLFSARRGDGGDAAVRHGNVVDRAVGECRLGEDCVDGAQAVSPGMMARDVRGLVAER